MTQNHHKFGSAIVILVQHRFNKCCGEVCFCPNSATERCQTKRIYTKKAKTFRFSLFVPPPQGLDCATCSRQSCAREFTPSQPPWKGDDSRVLAPEGCTKKGKDIHPSLSVPPQGVAYTRTEGRKTNNPWTWFAIGFDFLSKSCLTSQTYFMYPIFYNNSVPKTL